MPPPDPNLRLAARLVPIALLASVAIVGTAAILLAPAPETPLPAAAVWALAGGAALLLAAGTLLVALGPGAAAPPAGPPLPPARLVGLALCEGGGLLGAVLTFLTGAPLWAAALGLAAAASLLLAVVRS
jgi:hypothetical protein